MKDKRGKRSGGGDINVVFLIAANRTSFTFFFEGNSNTMFPASTVEICIRSNQDSLKFMNASAWS